MENLIADTKLDFLSDGSEMSELIRGKHWDKTTLGSPDKWPQRLRTPVSRSMGANKNGNPA